MSCCGSEGGIDGKQVAVPQRTLPYKYLFKYIIVGDTGMIDVEKNFHLLTISCWKIMLAVAIY